MFDENSNKRKVNQLNAEDLDVYEYTTINEKMDTFMSLNPNNTITQRNNCNQTAYNISSTLGSNGTKLPSKLNRITSEYRNYNQRSHQINMNYFSFLNFLNRKKKHQTFSLISSSKNKKLSKSFELNQNFETFNIISLNNHTQNISSSNIELHNKDSIIETNQKDELKPDDGDDGEVDNNITNETCSIQSNNKLITQNNNNLNHATNNNNKKNADLISSSNNLLVDKKHKANKLRKNSNINSEKPVLNLKEKDNSNPTQKSEEIMCCNGKVLSIKTKKNLKCTDKDIELTSSFNDSVKQPHQQQQRPLLSKDNESSYNFKVESFLIMNDTNDSEFKYETKTKSNYDSRYKILKERLTETNDSIFSLNNLINSVNKFINSENKATSNYINNKENINDLSYDQLAVTNHKPVVQRSTNASFLQVDGQRLSNQWGNKQNIFYVKELNTINKRIKEINRRKTELSYAQPSDIYYQSNNSSVERNKILLPSLESARNEFESSIKPNQLNSDSLNNLLAKLNKNELKNIYIDTESQTGKSETTRYQANLNNRVKEMERLNRLKQKSKIHQTNVISNSTKMKKNDQVQQLTADYEFNCKKSPKSNPPKSNSPMTSSNSSNSSNLNESSNKNATNKTGESIEKIQLVKIEQNKPNDEKMRLSSSNSGDNKNDDKLGKETNELTNKNQIFKVNNLANKPHKSEIYIQDNKRTKRKELRVIDRIEPSLNKFQGVYTYSTSSTSYLNNITSLKCDYNLIDYESENEMSTDSSQLLLSLNKLSNKNEFMLNEKEVLKLKEKVLLKLEKPAAHLLCRNALDSYKLYERSNSFLTNSLQEPQYEFQNQNGTNCNMNEKPKKISV
jgi:hypothetical protein